MRIIAGRFRGRKLKVPGGFEVRPTSDRVREAIFSMIGEKIRGKEVLDLFAGSGAFGIEAISRGAARSIFVEKSRQISRTLSENIRNLAIDKSRFKVVISDSIDYLKKAGREGTKFDLVFIDPPYESDLGEIALATLAKSSLLNAGGMMVLETGKGKIPETGDPLILAKERKYGDTSILIFSLREEIE